MGLESRNMSFLLLIAGSNEREFVKQFGQLHEQIAIAFKGNLICRYFYFLIASLNLMK